MEIMMILYNAFVSGPGACKNVSSITNYSRYNVILTSYEFLFQKTTHGLKQVKLISKSGEGKVPVLPLTEHHAMKA
jgi:hypothetical protein